MQKRTVIIISVTSAVVILAGLGVLIWWLVAERDPFRIVQLEGQGFSDIDNTAAFTRIRRSGDMFWWFFPATTTAAASRPIVLWLDSVTGTPPSLLANFGMFGPYDFNLNRRSDSWVDQYNLLFVDAPLGTGFSTAEADDRIPDNMDENIDHLMYTLEAFYSAHGQYADAPLYIFGQGDGSQLALPLAIRLFNSDHFSHNLKGIILGNAIVSPALVLTKLGFYLEELGYIDGNGRAAIEALSTEINDLVSDSQLENAFDRFLSLGEFINENAGAVAVNLGHIVEKLTRDSTQGYFGQWDHLKALRTDMFSFMDESVAPALGISGVSYGAQQASALGAFRKSFMQPSVEQVEHILRNTNLRVIIYNGNLDAVSNTPGQLEWVNNLQWPGQQEFLSSPRRPLILNGVLEGYFRETNRLTFYWMNAAGQSVPLDSPLAMRRVLDRITED